MSQSYEEIIEGESMWRFAPGPRHEQICERLFTRVLACVANLPSIRLLQPREALVFSAGNVLRPDLNLLTAATHKPWLVAEVIESGDHHTDTVIKKAIYEELRLPRLWMVDPRYDNVEVYHGTRYGLALKAILTVRDVLTEAVLPGLELRLAELFAEG
jgi:Uma2 family endonuclease